jgi:hypothetical protein
VSIPAVSMDLMIHIDAEAVARVRVHADEDRVVIGLRDSDRTGELTLFLNRAALVNLHTLTGSALAELTDQQAEFAASAQTADSPAA